MMKLDTQLLRWSETSNGGFTITLLCADEDAAREYFRDKTLRKGKQAGQLFAMTIDELDEHGNEPPPVPRRFHGGPISRLLILDWCKSRVFWEWAGVNNEAAAAKFVKDACEVESRNQIDGNLAAEHSFHTLIRLPYQLWLTGEATEPAHRVAA